MAHFRARQTWYGASTEELMCPRPQDKRLPNYQAMDTLAIDRCMTVDYA